MPRYCTASIVLRRTPEPRAIGDLGPGRARARLRPAMDAAHERIAHARDNHRSDTLY